MLTDTYRQQTLALRAQTLRDLHKLWPALDWRRLDSTYPAWFTAVSALISRDRQTAAGLASAYLKAFRLSQGVPGNPRIVLAQDVPPAQVSTALRVTTVVAAKRSAAAGKTAAQAMADAFVMSSGSATRLVLDGGRDTIRQSLAVDPRAIGWQRVTSGRSCEFCAMLAGRGAVYKADTADFQSHDHCSCTAEPVYR